MKINKKVLIPVFATAMGLSVIGGISGAVAWYQYNSKVTASYVGTSVADTGVLQISSDKTNWKRDITQGFADTDNFKLYPVTFGQLSGAAPATGHMYPEAGQYGYEGWQTATANTHYAQFKLYFKAIQPKEDATSATDAYEAVARDVYLSRYVINLLDENDDPVTGKNVDEALRIQLAVTGGSQVLLGKTAGTTNLYGNLDLDGNNVVDKYHETAFDDRDTIPSGKNPGDPIMYGIENETQVISKSLSEMVNARGTNGSLTEDNDKKLFTTTGGTAEPVEVTVTIWLEGWALLNNGSENSAIWNPFLSAGYKVQLGLEFDTGMFRDTDLTQYGA